MGAASFSARFVVRLAALLALVAAGVFTLSAAPGPDAPPPKPPDKPARPPEEEDTDAKPISHHVTSDEPDDSGAKTTRAPRAVDLKAAARDAKHVAVRKLFRELAVPHDVLKMAPFAPKQRNQAINIAPIPDYIDDDTKAIVEPFTVTPFSDSWVPGDPVQVPRNSIDHITPYEKLALQAVDELSNGKYDQSADPKLFLSRYQRDVAQAQALTTVLLRLQSARQTGGRRGDAWQGVEDALKKKLFGVLLDERDDRVQLGQWDEAFTLTKDLAGTYQTPEEQERIAQPLADLVKEALTRAANDDQRAEARQRLLQLQQLFPNSAVIAPVSEELKKQAQSLFEAAKGENDPTNRDKLLNEAKEAWPTLPGLRDYEIQVSNRYTTLRVGVRQLPARMSPGLASTDSDLRAVELVFESLVKLDADGAGGSRWEPGLAQGRPIMIPRGRRFDLSPEVRWSTGKVVTVYDVRETLKQMRAGRVPARPPVWAGLLDPLESLEAASNAHRAPLTLSQGWLDPLALMNFKILPQGVDVDSEEFAADPKGSGPYVHAKPKAGEDEGGRPFVAFTANPYYGARPGKDKLPRIEKIHFIAYNFKDDSDPKNDHKEELAALLADRPGRLDLLLDLTAREAAVLQEQAAAFKIKKVTGRASPNRRIYFLAVNHEKLHLDNAAFRCALAYAINRTELLDKDFRASPGQDLHSPLNGPYPIGSWAANPALSTKHGDKTTFDPFDADGARAKLRESAVQGATIPLIYPTGDPQAAKAMTDLAAQVKQEIGVTLDVKAVSPNDLRDAVERDHSYSLAYYHYDFPDDVYWLGPLLDSVSDKKENILQYRGSLSDMVRDMSRQRDFKAVRGWAYQLHDKFLKEEMPFIPLWQLDPLAAVHADVDTGASDPPFDPVLVFPDVDRWTVNRK